MSQESFSTCYDALTMSMSTGRNIGTSHAKVRPELSERVMLMPKGN